MTFEKASEELMGRFWAKVPSKPEDPSVCWPWGGGRNSDNYGYFRSGPRVVRVHVFALEQLLERSLLPGKKADHLCHTKECKVPPDECPHRLCVRPSHLAEVTPKENVARRNRPPRGETATSATTKDANIADVKSLNISMQDLQEGPPPMPKLPYVHNLSGLEERMKVIGQWEKDNVDFNVRRWKKEQGIEEEPTT